MPFLKVSLAVPNSKARQFRVHGANTAAIFTALVKKLTELGVAGAEIVNDTEHRLLDHHALLQGLSSIQLEGVGQKPSVAVKKEKPGKERQANQALPTRIVCRTLQKQDIMARMKMNMKAARKL